MRADAIAEAVSDPGLRHENLAVRTRRPRERRHVDHDQLDRFGPWAIRDDQAGHRDKMQAMVESRSLWNLPTAKKLAKNVEPHDPIWFQEPIRMKSPQALAEYDGNGTGLLPSVVERRGFNNRRSEA